MDNRRRRRRRRDPAQRRPPAPGARRRAQPGRNAGPGRRRRPPGQGSGTCGAVRRSNGSAARDGSCRRPPSARDGQPLRRRREGWRDAGVERERRGRGSRCSAASARVWSDVGFGQTERSCRQRRGRRLWCGRGTPDGREAWTVPSLTYNISFDHTGAAHLQRQRRWHGAGLGSRDRRAAGEPPRGPTASRSALFSPAGDTLLVFNGSRVRLWPVAAESAGRRCRPAGGRAWIVHAELRRDGQATRVRDGQGRGSRARPGRRGARSSSGGTAEGRAMAPRSTPTDGMSIVVPRAGRPRLSAWTVPTVPSVSSREWGGQYTHTTSARTAGH